MDFGPTAIQGANHQMDDPDQRLEQQCVKYKGSSSLKTESFVTTGKYWVTNTYPACVLCIRANNSSFLVLGLILSSNGYI